MYSCMLLGFKNLKALQVSTRFTRMNAEEMLSAQILTTQEEHKKHAYS